MKKSSKALLTAAAVTAGTFAVGYMAYAGIAFSKVIYKNRKPTPDIYPPSPTRDEEYQWSRFTPVDSLSAKSKDGLNLHAFRYIHEIKTDKWIIIQHGLGARASSMLMFARQFYERGYNILLPDLRVHGGSDGKYIGWGYYEKHDLMVWINEIIKFNPNAKILLLGHSLGAASVLMTSGQVLPDNVKGVIADSGFTNAFDAIKAHSVKALPFSADRVAGLLDRLCVAKAGYSLKQADAEAALKYNTLPVLLIHGTKDKIVNCEMSRKLFAAAGGNARLLIIDGAEHNTCFTHDEYWQAIDDFLEVNM